MRVAYLVTYGYRLHMSVDDGVRAHSACGVYWYVYNNKNEAAVIDCEGITHKFPIKQLIVRPDDIDHVVARNMNIQNE